MTLVKAETLAVIMTGQLSHILFVLCTQCHICMLRVVQFKQIDVPGVMIVTFAGLEQMQND